ncbi:MAG: NTP transferase domain-containing protein [Chitinophagaceae bacterium]
MTLKEPESIPPTVPGNYFGPNGRPEWSITGTTCEGIQQLVTSLSAALGKDFNFAYLDGRHDLEKEPQNSVGQLPLGIQLDGFFQGKPMRCRLTSGNQEGYANLISILAGADLVWVNGNHFEASNQLLVIDSQKKESVQKKLPLLKNVRLILMAQGEEEVFDFIREGLPNWGQIPVISILDRDQIISFFFQILNASRPSLNGLVLTGGRSIRMGSDKGKMIWQGKQHRYKLSELLKNFCTSVWISCREDQVPSIDPAYPSLPDTFPGLGPFGAILSAFRQDPGAAWLVVACDLPLLDFATLRFLVDHRLSSAPATAFLNPVDGLPEPLLTIWEPKSYFLLLCALYQGRFSPRAILQNNPIQLLKAPLPGPLFNVNTPEEKEQAQSLLHQKNKLSK